jgi:class 3 adenylate cyclase/DNA-binding MarR family transcriptional regulator
MRDRTSDIQRRLAAFFCADVAGYTRLMNVDERGTLRLLSAYREIADRQIERHGGRIANTAGDSILAEFPSAVDAVQCAVVIQEKIATANQEVAEERRVIFRIGIHVGEAMVREGDLFGDGVNVAARLQSLAQPGSICVSGTAHEYVHRLLPLMFEDLGPQAVKNLDAPVRAFVTHPAGEPVTKVLPPVHRNNEFYLARRFQALCMRALQEIAREVDLEALDTAVLATIDEAPGITLGQLGERAGIDLATTEQSVERLTQRRLLTNHDPNTDEQSGSGLYLTSTGLEVRLWFRTRFLSAQDRVMAPLSDRERDTFKDFLTRLIKANAADDGGS